MKDWNPDLYRQFEAERTRPAAELLARVLHPNAKFITDLGCGPGNSTELLQHAYPQALLTGLDTSQAMLEKARERLPSCRFEKVDIREWKPTQPQDIIYGNASLQWVTGHEELIPHLMQQLAPEGVFAVQMPDNLSQPSHQLMQKVADQPEWRNAIAGVDNSRKQLLTTEQYYDLLASQGALVDIWRTTYYHVMPSAKAIVDWLSATGLRPFLAPLDENQQEAFLASYLQELEKVYLPRADRSVLLAFPRLFLIARKSARH
ncbi:trans-aconitate 2-methyltransferase [Ewingella allii]|uniref:trans-aconitate 2-methyltransferase n=1 Tax=Ewingella allii TaxID=3092550 RepID=UPI0037A2AC29